MDAVDFISGVVVLVICMSRKTGVVSLLFCYRP